MEEYKETSSFQRTEKANTNRVQANTIEEVREKNYFSRQDDQQSAFSPNSDSNEQMHMAEFQRAIDRLRLRRQSSTSSQGLQVQEGSRKNSVVRDLLQSQKIRASTTFSSTCTSPISSNGAYSN